MPLREALRGARQGAGDNTPAASHGEDSQDREHHQNTLCLATAFPLLGDFKVATGALGANPS